MGRVELHGLHGFGGVLLGGFAGGLRVGWNFAIGVHVGPAVVGAFLQLVQLLALVLVAEPVDAVAEAVRAAHIVAAVMQ